MARLHLPPERLEGERVTLEGDSHKYLARVLRLGPGDEVVVFDGAGLEIAARVLSVGSKTTELALGARRQVALPTADLTLLQAVAKGERMEWIVQKTTELGVTRIVPVLAKRSVARPEGGEGRAQRWQTIAREAARQCGRADVPTIAPPVALAEALAQAGPTTATKLVLWEACTGRSLRRALAGTETHVALLVGPEGGFEAEEVTRAEASGFRAVGLGPRILRAETAAIVAVTLVQAALGGLDS